MIQENVQVLWNKQIADVCFRIGLTCDSRYSDATPGQFVMLRVSDQLNPLLRRPFSIFAPIKEKEQVTGIEVVYKVVGQGTEILSTLKRGDRVDMLGPLGKGFQIPDNCHCLFLVAGGIGVPPMNFLALYLKENTKDLSKCSVFLGGRSTSDLLQEDDFEKVGIPVHIVTDDGSRGEKGVVTDLLEKKLKAVRPDMICACGPMEMLNAVARLAKLNNIACQVSIETLMACGMGACLGCAVEGNDDNGKYLHACVDGPVFDADNLNDFN